MTMRLLKFAAPILATLALCLIIPGKLAAQTVIPVKPAAKQAVPGAQPAAKPGQAPAPKTTAAPAKPGPAKVISIKPAVASKPAVAPKTMPAAKPAEKPAPKVEEVKAAAPSALAAPEAVDAVIAKRDPFVSPLATKAGGGGPVLPPGKAGLVVATVRIDGTVKSGDGMVAMVSNPEKHVYFVREGDRLYDGDVETISLDGVTFRENSKDAFGKPVERMVTKRIYQSAGESQ
jgi:hypothetical protein